MNGCAIFARPIANLLARCAERLRERSLIGAGKGQPDEHVSDRLRGCGRLIRWTPRRSPVGTTLLSATAANSIPLTESGCEMVFRNVLVVTTILMTVLAATVAIVGFANKTLIPLCFEPENGGTAMVVCPTGESAPFSTDVSDPAAATDIDQKIEETAQGWDLFVVEFVGLAAAAVAAATAIRNIRGSSERYGIPIGLAVLKLPTGALTAFLGLLLMRGQFVPGLSALDTSAQILAWALVFGYGQQLFTRLVDRQGQNVLNSVRATSTVPAEPSP